MYRERLLMEVINSSDSSAAGNTKRPRQDSAAKMWCLTWNNYPATWYDDFIVLSNDSLEKYILGKEEGDKNNTPHIQGFVVFYIKKRFTELQKMYPKEIHWEKMGRKSSVMHNIRYCSKEDPNPKVKNLIVPKPVRVLRNEQLYDWQIEILQLLQDAPDDRKIHWYQGDGGCGKTSFCKYLVVKHNALVLSGKSADMKYAIVEYFENTGTTPELIVMNIPRSFNAEYVNYEGIENIKDMVFYCGKYKGGMICGNPPHLLIFANIEPDWTKLSSDRFVYKNLSPLVLIEEN